MRISGEGLIRAMSVAKSCWSYIVIVMLACTFSIFWQYKYKVFVFSYHPWHPFAKWKTTDLKKDLSDRFILIIQQKICYILVSKKRGYTLSALSPSVLSSETNTFDIFFSGIIGDSQLDFGVQSQLVVSWFHTCAIPTCTYCLQTWCISNK